MPRIDRSWMNGRRWALGLLVLTMGGAAAWNVAAGDGLRAKNSDDDDRTMAFVEKSVQATNLFNERKLIEALAMFQELSTKYADLDEDGYVAMGLADCLHAVGRNEESRKVYQAIAAGHPDLKVAANMKIREIDVAARDVSDVLIEELRQALKTAGDNRVSAQLQLGRALQKRAASLLKEAVATFRKAAEEDHDLAHPAQQAIGNQSVILAEIQEDLATLIDRVEKTWGLARTLGEIVDSGEFQRTGDAAMADYRAQWRAEATTGKQANVQAAWGKGQGTPQITVDGEPIKLNSTQALIIQRHQQRINAIIQEALQAERDKVANK